MATARLNISFQGVHGKIGNLLYRCYGSKVNVIPLPDYSRRRRNQRQKECSMNFAKAHADARKAMGDPVLRAWFAERKTRKYKTLRGFIMAEHLRRAKPPVPVRDKSTGALSAQDQHVLLQTDFDI